MIIRKEQTDALRSALSNEDAFVRRLVPFLRAVQPKRMQGIGDVAFHELILKSLERARSYGVQSESGLASWLEIVLAHGVEFDTKFPWAAAIIRDWGGKTDSLEQGNALVAELYDEAATQLPSSS